MHGSIDPIAGTSHPTSADIKRKPWKYIGYRGFTEFVSSDDDHFALRRFDELHARVLLKLQDDIAVLEKELADMDHSLTHSEEDIDNGCLRNDRPPRKQLLEKIEIQLNRYDKSLLRFLQLKSRPKAHERQIKNMTVWLQNVKGTIEEKETEFVKSSDLISVSKSEKSPLRRAFEWHFLGFFEILTAKANSEAPDKGLGMSVHGDDETVNIISSISIFATALVMLIAPLWILAALEDVFRKLAVITVFSIVFLAVMNWGTLGRPFEILAATAGYCAVLVVFLQMGS